MRWYLLFLLVTLLACDPDPKGSDADADGDGFVESEDCDDSDAAVNPDADDLCDGIDNDCDGEADGNSNYFSEWYEDADGDAFGSDAVTVEACAAPEGYIAEGGDCDDGDPDISPDAEDSCDGVDNDCDGEVDGDGEYYEPFYADTDGDGYGDPDGRQDACDQPAGTVENDEDCDDSRDWVYPGAEEWCHPTIDSDCDDSTHAEGRIGWYASSSTFEGNTVFNGTADEPAAVSIWNDATIYVCEGTYYANVTVEEGVNVDIVSVMGEGTVTFDGGGTGSVFTMVGDGTTVSMDRVMITNGAATLTDNYSFTAGGGIYCSGASTLSLTVSQIFENTASVAGGIYANACTVLLDDVDITDHAGSYSTGIVAETGASLDILGGVFVRNTMSGTSGGAVELSEAAADFDGVHFSENTVYDIYINHADGSEEFRYSDLGTATLSCDSTGCF